MNNPSISGAVINAAHVMYNFLSAVRKKATPKKYVYDLMKRWLYVVVTRGMSSYGWSRD